MSKKVIKIIDNLQFAEGPLWHTDGYLLVSDTAANNIKKITPNGDIEVFLENSGCEKMTPHANTEKLGSNGLKWKSSSKKQLVMCRQGEPSIAIFDGVSIHTLTGSFDGKPYNSPNDLVISRNGIIYFTDPPYGVEGEKLSSNFRQPVAGVYALQNDEVSLLFTGLNYPNGVCLSPDEKYLYVSSNHPDEAFIYRANLEKSNLVFEVFTSNNADGILCDEQGNIYTASGKYINKFSPTGNKIDSFFIGEPTSNLTWGGPQMKDLYVSCYHSVWHIPNVLA